jgi:hypothetical protein
MDLDNEAEDLQQQLWEVQNKNVELQKIIESDKNDNLKLQ